MYFTKKENSFNYKVAFIFFVNTLFGPDLIVMFAIWELHSLIGFTLLAIPLSLFYSYFSRFSLIKSGKKFFPIKLEDDGIRKVNWKNSDCITIAGGFSHFFIDHLFYPDISMELWPSIRISQMELITFWGMDAYEINPFYIVGNVILASIILISLYCFRKGYKSTLILFLITIGLTRVILLMSQAFIGSLKELAVLFFCAIYIFLPFFLLMYAACDVQDKPIETLKEFKISKKTQLKIVILISIFMTLGLILYAYFIIKSAKIVALIFFTVFGGDIEEMTISVVIIGYINLILDFILLIGLIGLFFKNNLCRYIVITICSYLFILAFPFAIALVLCEKDVKAIFRKELENELGK